MVMTPVRQLPEPTKAERRRRRGGWLLPLVSLVVVLAVLGGAYAYFTRQAATHRGGQAPAATAMPSQAGTAPRSLLTAAADALAGYTPPPAEGRYTHVWTEQWARDGDGISPRQVQLFLAADGSGREYTWALPTIDTAAFMPAAIGNTPFRAAQPSIQDYTAGQMPRYLEAPSTDPGQLLAQLHTIEPAGNGAPGVLRAVASFHTQACPEIGVRIALLRVLADMDGLTVNDHAADETGRRGYAITATTAIGTDTLIIDPVSGLVLSLAQTYTADAKAPAVHQYLIYKSCGHTDTIDPAVIA